MRHTVVEKKCYVYLFFPFGPALIIWFIFLCCSFFLFCFSTGKAMLAINKGLQRSVFFFVTIFSIINFFFFFFFHWLHFIITFFSYFIFFNNPPVFFLYHYIFTYFYFGVISLTQLLDMASYASRFKNSGYYFFIFIFILL